MRLLVAWLLGVPTFLAVLFTTSQLESVYVSPAPSIPVTQHLEDTKSNVGNGVNQDEAVVSPSGTLG
jgi:hypothetical protein